MKRHLIPAVLLQFCGPKPSGKHDYFYRLVHHFVMYTFFKKNVGL